MNPKILLDEDIQLQLAFSLRRRGIDAIHIQEINRKGKTDEEQLNFALSQQRCLVSFNVKDFVLLHEKF
ncbi:MAG: DUF5615 family PIN-like protein [Ignavibacteria bacterium]|nr:DUF5615 family PIN-like protein [Ignavibacteria bacterium]